MTITIEIPSEEEAAIREAQERQDRETLKGLLGELAASALLDTSPLEQAVSRLLGRTSEEKQRDREELLALATTPRILPEGKSVIDSIFGQWPGQETDEQVRKALDDL